MSDARRTLRTPRLQQDQLAGLHAALACLVPPATVAIINLLVFRQSIGVGRRPRG